MLNNSPLHITLDQMSHAIVKVQKDIHIILCLDCPS